MCDFYIVLFVNELHENTNTCLSMNLFVNRARRLDNIEIISRYQDIIYIKIKINLTINDIL